MTITYPKKAEVNPEDQIGQVIEIPGGCAVAGSVSNFLRDYIPQNGEYEWAGEGSSCHFCMNSAPNSTNVVFGCDPWYNCFGECGGSVAGKGGSYMRSRYLANPKECCLSDSALIDGKTCDPKYRDHNGIPCKTYLTDFCSGETIFNNSECQSWCSENKEICDDKKSRYCNAPGMIDSNLFCKDWCKKNPGKCDDAMFDYCKKNPKDDLCSCIYSDVSKLGGKYNPICVDRKCETYGYQTLPQITAAKEGGCHIVDCGTYFDLKAEGIDLTNIKTDQNCGNYVPKNNDLINTPWYSKGVIILTICVVVIVIFLLIVIIGILFYKKNK